MPILFISIKLEVPAEKVPKCSTLCCSLTGIPPFLLRQEDSDHVFRGPPKPTTEELVKVLQDVRLGYLLSRFGLDSTCEWSSILSLGEQQRLAFARLLLAKPCLILMDESTSALDEDNEVCAPFSSELPRSSQVSLPKPSMCVNMHDTNCVFLLHLHPSVKCIMLLYATQTELLVRKVEHGSFLEHAGRLEMKSGV